MKHDKESMEISKLRRNLSDAQMKRDSLLAACLRSKIEVRECQRALNRARKKQLAAKKRRAK